MRLFLSRHAGFTLLELLVVMAILGGILGLVAPNLRVDTDEQQITEEARALRAFLQNAIDDAWMEREDRILLKNQQTLIIQRKLSDEWQDVESYTLPQNVTSTILVTNSLLNRAKESLAVSEPRLEWAMFRHGEYLPIEWQLTSGERSQTVTGDGINALAID